MASCSSLPIGCQSLCGAGSPAGVDVIDAPNQIIAAAEAQRRCRGAGAVLIRMGGIMCKVRSNVKRDGCVPAA